MQRKKTIRVALIVMVVLLAGWGIFKWVVRSGAVEKKLKGEITNLVYKGSGGLYHLSIGSIGIDPDEMRIDLHKVSLIPDTVLLKELKTQGKEPAEIFRFSVDILSIHHITPAKFIADKKIDLKSVFLHESLIEIIQLKKREKNNNPTDSLVPLNTLYTSIKKDVSSIIVDSIMISSLNIKYINAADRPDTTSVQKINLLATDFLLNDSSHLERNRFLFAREVLVQMVNFKTPLKNKLYEIQFDTLKMIIADKTQTRIKGVQLKSVYSEADYSKHIKTQQERFDVSVPLLFMRNFDYHAFLETAEIISDSIILNDAELHIFKDRTKQFDGKTRVGKYPHQLLQQSGLFVNVDVCVLKNTTVIYREKSEQTGAIGEVRFTGTDGLVKPIYSNAGRSSLPVLITANTRFMGAGPLEATFMLYPSSEDGRFSVKGKFSAFDLQALNAASVPLGEVKMSKGTLDDLTFNLNGNDYYSNVGMQFSYRELEVEILKRQDDASYKKRGLLSFAANNFLLKSSNNKENRSHFIKLRYQRDTDKSMFNLIWKSLFSGMKEIAGAGGLGKDKDRVKVLNKN